MSMPKAPDTLGAVISSFEQSAQHVADLVGTMTDEQLETTVQFLAGPGKLRDLTKLEFLWYFLLDQIHHRGQFSIYLRMAGAKVPSSYGPTADEPWM